MQNKLKITQASLNQTALDWPRNMANIYAAVDEAAKQESDILALEELTLTGYEANDEFQRTDNDRILEALKSIAAYAPANLIISIGHPWRLQLRELITDSVEKNKNPLYDRTNLPFNVQTVISGGKILGMTAKTYLFNNERGYEKRYFSEWSIEAANALGGKFGTIEIEIEGLDYKVPFGRPVINFNDGKKSFNLTHAICEEKWIATKFDGQTDDSLYAKNNIIPAITHYVCNSEGLILLIPNASPPASGKMEKHHHLAKLASQYADVVVDTDGLGSSGSTFAQFGFKNIAQKGKVISCGKIMSFKRADTATSVVEVSNAPTNTKFHIAANHQFKDYKGEEFYKPQNWERLDNPNRKYEEIIRNTALWLFDNMRKTGIKGIAEALSGGADSAFNSTIVSVMVNMGVKELGAEGFCAELGIPYKPTADEIMPNFLTCVYMGTDNSSEDTRFAAEFLINGGVDPETGEKVKGIGGKFLNRNVQKLLKFYSDLYGEEVLPSDGVAYENIQARGREVLIMLFANKENKMAIANPNLDEARNAYATFGGDLHSGTINLNAHLNKDLQLDVMRYMRDFGVEGIMPPIKSLSAVLRNKPSAELQPKDESGKVVQTDEAAMQRNFKQMNAISDCMLYAVKKTTNGDRRLNASEVFETCKKDKLFDAVDENTLYNMVRLSYVRWGISQHKIHASPIAPTFGHNVDHQTSQRTPNLHGQSKDELAILGIDLIFSWAKEDGLQWNEADRKILVRLAWQNEEFVKEFDKLVYRKSENIDYDLKKLYNEIKEKSIKAVFKSLKVS